MPGVKLPSTLLRLVALGLFAMGQDQAGVAASAWAEVMKKVFSSLLKPNLNRVSSARTRVAPCQ